MVLSLTGGRYRVDCGGEVVEASLRGRMKRGRLRVLVGDEVTLAYQEDGAATIEDIGPRRSLLRRRSPGRSHGTRPVAANIDQVVVVGAALDPEWNPLLMDRFMAVAEANGLPIVVVVNKIDLDPGAERHAAPYSNAGYQVLLVSVKSSAGLDELATTLAGSVSLFTGPSGVGKSSLLNALSPGLQLRTAEVSKRSRAGRHTTVSAEMYRIGRDAYVVDTPGLRDIGLWGLDAREVAAAFPELARYAGQCRFDNCRHLQEPKCAVVAAVDRGELSETRVESYRRLLEEADRATRPWE